MKRKKAVSRKKKIARRPATSLMAMAEEPASGSEANEKFFRLYKPRKVPITIRLDADVVEWFRTKGTKYQTRINGVLRRVMEEEVGE